MSKLILKLLCLVFSIAAIGAEIPRNPILSRYFLVPKDEATMNKIASRFEVQLKQANGFVVIIPANEKNTLLSLAPDARLLEADMTAELMKKVGKDRAGWHNFNTVQTHL